MITLCSKIIDGTFQLYYRIILKEHFENMHWSHRTTFTTVWSFRNFLPREMYFTKKVAVTHRNTVISHLIYMKFAFTPVCVVSSGRLFFHKGDILARVSCNLIVITTTSWLYWYIEDWYRTFQKLCDLGLEYCYGLFQAIKYSIANWKSLKYSGNNNRF